MGKELSHILCAEQTARGLGGSAGDSLRPILRECSEAFHLGSIAADTFFYAVRMPFESGGSPCYGDLLHGRDGADTSAPIHEMLRVLRDTPHDPLLREKTAFLCGFLTHIALDSVLHPFVYHRSGDYYAECPRERQNARVRHRLIEAWIDLYLIEQSSLDLSGCSFLQNIRRNGHVNKELLRFFFASCVSAIGVDSTAWRYLLRGYRVQMTLNSAFRQARTERLVRRVDRLAGGRLKSFLALFYPHGFGEIPGEIVHFPKYHHPVTGEEHEGGLQRIWSQAVERGREFLESAGGFLFRRSTDIDVRRVIRGYNLSTGLVGISMAGAVHFDCIPTARLWSPETRV